MDSLDGRTIARDVSALLALRNRDGVLVYTDDEVQTVTAWLLVVVAGSVEALQQPVEPALEARLDALATCWRSSDASIDHAMQAYFECYPVSSSLLTGLRSIFAEGLAALDPARFDKLVSRSEGIRGFVSRGTTTPEGGVAATPLAQLLGRTIGMPGSR